MTTSDLKYHHETQHPDSHFFTRSSMRFSGDRMSNYGCRQATVETHDGETVECWELWRKRPVKHGLQNSAYFSRETFERIHPKND